MADDDDWDEPAFVAQVKSLRKSSRERIAELAEIAIGPALHSKK